MNITKKFIWLLITGVMVCMNLVVTAQAEEFAIVINAKNSIPSGEQALKEIRLLYLKNKRRWENGDRATPYGLLATNEGQKTFIRKVLKMSGAELTHHWLNKKQTTGETPPKALKSERIILRLVAKKSGAFGIVSGKSITKLPATVKVLAKF